MKAFISVDMEGMPYVVIPGHLNLKGALYEEARKTATRVTLTTAEELHRNGFDEVVVADSHGPMVNLHLTNYLNTLRLSEDIPVHLAWSQAQRTAMQHFLLARAREKKRIERARLLQQRDFDCCSYSARILSATHKLGRKRASRVVLRDWTFSDLSISERESCIH